MKILKNNLDEMQEQKLLNIEHYGCWFAFWGLLISIIVQMILYRENSFRMLAGEWIVFMCLSLYILIACIRNGIWDRRLQATTKVNLIASAIAGLVVGVSNSLISYCNYGDMKTALLTAAFALICTFALCFAGLSLAASMYKKRKATLENKAEAEGDANE